MLPISPLYILYYLPLLLAISLVYGGTRHEDLRLILRHACHTAYWISAFMVFVFVILAGIAMLI